MTIEVREREISQIIKGLEMIAELARRFGEHTIAGCIMHEVNSLYIETDLTTASVERYTNNG